MTAARVTGKHGDDVIIGGFTSLPWSSSDIQCTIRDSNAFLFCFEATHSAPLRCFGIETKNSEDAVIHCRSRGPIFGKNDLAVLDDATHPQEAYIRRTVYAMDVEQALPLELNGYSCEYDELEVFSVDVKLPID